MGWGGVVVGWWWDGVGWGGVVVVVVGAAHPYISLTGITARARKLSMGLKNAADAHRFRSCRYARV